MLKIRSVESEGYDSQSDLLPMIDRLQGNAVLISDPSNPLGDKHDDEEQLNIIKKNEKPNPIPNFNTFLHKL